ncbi:unnamed protein product [Lupinus luteus]|uniref:Uncharacterized protein n=1 Tax=Lupinus luteus TaxID=3873 RepID=A0AAV1YNW1_LUPLU
MLPATAPSRVPHFGGKSFEVNVSMLHARLLELVQSPRWTHSPIFVWWVANPMAPSPKSWIASLSPSKGHSRRVVARETVEIRPLASKNPVCLPRKKDVRWCRVGFCILAYYRGASCLPACPCTLVGQDGAPWGAPPTPQQAIPSMLVGCWVVRLSGGRAEASSVTLSSRKDVVLGEAFRGIAVARRGASPISRK